MLDKQALDLKLQSLQAKKLKWAQLPLSEKIELLEQVLDATYAVRQEQAELSSSKKQIPSNSHLVGEEWLNGPVIQCRNIRLAIESLRRIDEETFTIPKSKVSKVSQNQVGVEVFPTSMYDRLMFDGVKGVVWLNDRVSKKNLKSNIAIDFKQSKKQGSVSLVLGAGNVASIGPLDVIQKLLEGKVVILKLNPVNEYLGPIFEKSFKPLIDQGYVQIAYGGADVGEYLCQNHSVDDIHITGSDKTHDVICYGPGAQGQKAKQADKPRLYKTITSELGNVSPIIIVPGNWKEHELRFHAENVATQLVNNAGFNCLAARVLVLSETWAQKDQFMQYLGETFEQLEPRIAYYPGAKERYQKFINPHLATTKQYGCNKEKEGVLPWTVIENLDSTKPSICFDEESFCPIIAQTSIHANSTKEYLDKAVNFCNKKLWGTLSASIIVDPDTQKKNHRSFNKALRQLRYGAIGVNQWHALAYALGSTSWGAYPGHTWDNIQSGQGTVHNTYFLNHIEKSVVTGPFTVTHLMPFKPAWFASNKAMVPVAKALCDMEYRPNFTHFAKLVLVTAWGAAQGQWQNYCQSIKNFFGYNKTTMKADGADSADSADRADEPVCSLPQRDRIQPQEQSTASHTANPESVSDQRPRVSLKM